MMKSRHSFLSRSAFLTSAFAASGIIALTSGCASGGFKLTREYAQWVNSSQIIIRILLYIFTSFIFVITMLVDLVFNNTLDFWGGRVSQGTYHFKDGEKTFVAKHEILPGGLKRSIIDVSDLHGKHLQTVVLRQTASSEIELVVDGIVRTRVSDIHHAPVASIFDAKGLLVQGELSIDTPVLAAR